jgi:hypothetical protein
MAYTKFGEFMRIQRIKNHEVMGDTAELLGVKLPFISAVENGKRNVPDGWFEILVSHYSLNEEEQKQLREAIDLSKTQIKIPLVGESSNKRNVAVLFQRSFDSLDEETTQQIIKLLNGDE